MDSVLVIIVTYNGMQWLDKCLNSVYESSVSLDAIVIDNGSTDGTQDYIKENYSQVKFVQSQENLGFGKANNIGLQYALEHNYDYVYLLNQDAWIMPDTVDKLINIHKKNPNYGILSPFQIQANMQFLDKIFVSGVCSYPSNSYLLDDLYFNRLKDIYVVPLVMAAHWLISKECLQQVGGFSPTFPHYGEDDNYANRTLYHGFKIGIVPHAVAVHDRGNRKETKQHKIYRGYISNLVLLSEICNRSPHVKISVFKRLFMQIIYFHSLMPLRYFYDIVVNMSEIKKNVSKSRKKCAFLK